MKSKVKIIDPSGSCHPVELAVIPRTGDVIQLTPNEERVGRPLYLKVMRVIHRLGNVWKSERGPDEILIRTESAFKDGF